MPIFVSKPVRIEAWQYDGGTNRGVCNCPSNPQPHLHTMHNGQTVALEIGDWIVPEPVADRYYPIKPDVFEGKYERPRGGLE